MKRIYFILIFCFFKSICGAKSIYIDHSIKGYIFNSQRLLAGKKSCFIFNALQSDVLLDGPYAGNRPLIVFQIFGLKETLIKEVTPEKYEGFKDFVTQTVLPSLKADRIHDITDMIGATPNVESTYMADSLIIRDKEKTTLYTGVIKIDVFNVISYEQFTPIQTNQTLLNTSALITPVSKWTKDSLPIFKADYIDRKIFLQKKLGDLFTFYKIPERDEDNPMAFIIGFVYRNNKGIVKLKTRYLEQNNSTGMSGESLKVSDEYFTFE